MNNENIGKLLLQYRKDKNITQQALAETLGVSPKTISKWETARGMPDVYMLEKISKTLNIKIDDLLKGKTKKKNKYLKYICLIIFIIIIISIFIILNKKHKNNADYEFPCIMEANYYIHQINPSNDENYKYITISMYQMEGVYTIRVDEVIAKQITEHERYKFTFGTKENYQNATPDTLFTDSKILNITKSDEEKGELGMKYSCLKK